MIVSNTFDYYSYDVVTKTEIITEMKSTFPVVTICDENPLITKYAQSLMEN